MSKMEIACSADAGYLPHVSVMLHSLLENTPTRPVRIWLFHGGELPEDGCKLLEQVIQDCNAELEYLPIKDEMAHGFSMKHFHPAAWYRVLLPQLLPQLNKILYLDCDVIVTDDVTPLWNTNLDGYMFGAVCNPLFPLMRNWPKKDLGLSDPLDYLNSGVLLMNLELMRKEGLTETLRDYSIKNPERRLPEQDAMSVTMHGRWLKLHPRWNAQTTFYELRARQLPYSEEIVKETVDNPAIIHFNGPFKPWQYLCKHPLRNLYFDHLAKTPWPRKPLQGKNIVYRIIRPFPIAIQYSALEFRPIWVYIRKFIRQKLMNRNPIQSSRD